MSKVSIRHIYSAFCCDTCSLQWVLSGSIVATANQRCTWWTEIPSYAACQWSFA